MRSAGILTLVTALFLSAATLTAQLCPATADLSDCPAQALLDQARAANPERYQYALDQGARILPTTDGRSFYVLWQPPDSPATNPLIVTLHGSSSWAFDELFLRRDQAAARGYGILALQWWFGTESYYTPADIQRELRAALRLAGTAPGTALLYGYNRGTDNLYAVAALDRSSGDRLYAMFLANSGGAPPDYPPNLAIAAGQYGYNVFSGTYWTLVCGTLDPNSDRDGCPAMRRTADWVGLYGGVVDQFLQDDDVGHSAALDAFAAILALRQDALPPATVWKVERDAAFLIPDAATANVGLVDGDVWLIVGGPGGAKLYRSSDGANSTSLQSLGPSLNSAMSGTGYAPGEVIPRAAPEGGGMLYVLGLAPPGINRSAVFRLLAAPNGGYTRNPPDPVFAGAADDGQFLGVPDLTRLADGRWRLTYVSRGSSQSNSRTAISSDDGVTFLPEFNNTFGDLAVPHPTAMDINVDPAILKLAKGGYLAITMRSARLYLFTSLDGRTFVPYPQPAIDAPQLYPGATGLFDPTLVQLPDGRIWVYVTAATGNLNRVVRAELTPLLP